MFTRARPHVDVDALLTHLDACPRERPSTTELTSEFHFSSGRGALKWLLIELRQRFGQRLLIGVQAFTCEAVVHAIEESGNLATFVDIDLSTYSTSSASIENCPMDVLILTHLFGIPNPDYVEIADICRRRGVILIEDLAQSAGACIDAHQVGSLSDFSIFSFGFDKSISTYRGGMLRLGAREDPARWCTRFNRLLAEPEGRGRADLAALYLLFLETDPRRYRIGAVFPSLACATVARAVRDYGRGHAIARKATAVPGYRFAERVWGAVLRRTPIFVRRMSAAKRGYLDVLFADLPRLARLRGQWFELARTELTQAFPSLSFPATPPSAKASPARLAVLARAAERESIADRFTAAGLEAGAFNWPYVAADFATKSPASAEAKGFPQSRALVDRVLNLPLWSEQSWIGFSARAR